MPKPASSWRLTISPPVPHAGAGHVFCNAVCVPSPSLVHRWVVYYHLWFGHLPIEQLHRILIATNRPRPRRTRASGEGLGGVQTFLAAPSRIQILARCCTGCCHGVLHDIFRNFQCPGFLAYPPHVLAASWTQRSSFQKQLNLIALRTID